jgi:pimeloyl-ACP methyl ester carboxylesterase
MSIAHEYVVGPGGRIDVRTVGCGPTVVMIASLGRGATDFDELAMALAPHGYRVAAPEPRGVAGTEGLTTELGLDDLAHDVAAVIGHFGTTATVLGHAFGNRLARMTATIHGDLVDGVVLLACGGLVPPGDQAAKALDEVFDTGLDEQAHLEAVRVAFFAPGNDPSVWRDGWYPAVADMQRKALTRIKPAVWWTAGTARVLVVQAAEDAIALPANSEELVSALGDRAQLVTIDHAGHAILPEQPQQVLDAIVSWLGAR